MKKTRFSIFTSFRSKRYIKLDFATKTNLIMLYTLGLPPKTFFPAGASQFTLYSQAFPHPFILHSALKIGDEGTRGVSGGERRRVSIGVDIIHGPSLLFLDEPTSGLDSTSAQSVIDRLHDIARTGSTVILTIHQPSHRIQMLLDHLIILARGQLMYQGAPKDVSSHLGRMGRKVPKGENSIEYLLDVIQEYDQSELGVTALADFAITGMKPPKVSDLEISFSTIIQTPPPTPIPMKYWQELRPPTTVITAFMNMITSLISLPRVQLV